MPSTDNDLLLTLTGKISVDSITVRRTITLSGVGEAVQLIDRVGDFHDTQAAGRPDIPTRSMELVQALRRSQPTHPPVEFDIGGFDRPVGFTHAFDPATNLDEEEKKTDATLRLRVSSDDPAMGFLTDYVILDVGCRTSNGEQGDPLVMLVDFEGFPDNPELNKSYVVELKLSKAPVYCRSHSPERSLEGPQERDLRSFVNDGRLNVIVADDSNVDFSDVIVFKDLK